jgi:hypothetical protein
MGTNDAEIRGDNFIPRMPCQWHVRGGEEGTEMANAVDSDWSVSPPPTPIGMEFGRLKLWAQENLLTVIPMPATTALCVSLLNSPWKHR